MYLKYVNAPHYYLTLTDIICERRGGEEVKINPYCLAYDDYDRSHLPFNEISRKRHLSKQGHF